MPIPITIPRLGWNMEQGTFVEWLKADGDAVNPGDLLYRLEGEKSVEEIESFDSGVLSIPADGPKPGDSVTVGTVIGYLISRDPTDLLISRDPKGSATISPRARRLAKQNGIDPSQLHGSGKTGRIRERDVAAAVPATPAGSRRHPEKRSAIAARMVASRQTTAPVTLTCVVDAANLVNLREQFKAAAG